MLHITCIVDGKGKERKNELPAIGKKQIWEHLRNLKMQKSMAPNEMHPCVLRDLTEEVAKQVAILWIWWKDQLVDKELATWSHLKSWGQWLDVQVETSDKHHSLRDWYWMVPAF